MIIFVFLTLETEGNISYGVGGCDCAEFFAWFKFPPSNLVNVVGVRLALEFLELFTLLPLAMCSLSLLSIMSCMME